jgi:hypothetical protein
MNIRTILLVPLLAAMVGSGLDQPSQAAPAVDGPKYVITSQPREVASDSRTEGIAGGYVFVPISPYRTFDSRDFADPILGGEEGIIDVISDQSGTITMIPASAVAVTFTLTVTNTVGSGYLALYPSDINWPGNSTTNWSASNQTIAVGGTVALGNYFGPGEVAVYAGPAVASLGTHFLIDITGYYI